MPAGGRPGDDPGSPVRRWQYGRLTLMVAAALTLSMFGWQAWHLYDSYRAVSERDSGDCPTRAVEAVYSAGERLDYLVEEIEHSLFFWGATAASSPIQQLGERYDATNAELEAALDHAAGLAKGNVADAVTRLQAAHRPVDDYVRGILGFINGGEPEIAAAVAAGAQFAGVREEYTSALGDMWMASREHLVRQLQAERRSELLSVGVALLLFATAVGAWALFIRRIRRGQALLEEEARHRRQAEEELLQAQKMDALGLMAGGIAHDFNNLLTAIWGSATSARASLDDDHPAVPALHRIEEAAEQANGVIGGLLTFSRRTSLRRAPVEIGALIDETAALLDTMLPASIELQTDHPEEALLWVSGDRTQLQQSLVNLAINAREAMPQGGRLLVRAWLCTARATAGSPGSVVIEVADTGEGIPHGVQAKIFDPFFTTRAPGQGTGLGLSIVHGIVADHDGTVRVQSAPGKGTSMLVELPAIVAPLEGDAPAGAEPRERRFSGEVVLLVEDHQHVREIVAEALEDAGLNVLQAATGEEFLEQFEQHRDEAVLAVLDLDIPGPNGLACLRRTREQGSLLPMIIITGTSAPGLEGEVAGEAVVLRKPFTMSDLIRAIAESLYPPVVAP